MNKILYNSLGLRFLEHKEIANIPRIFQGSKEPENLELTLFT